MSLTRSDLIKFHGGGFGYTISEDSDGLGCVEISYEEKQMKNIKMIFTPEDAALIGGSLIEMSNRLINRDKK